MTHVSTNSIGRRSAGAIAGLALLALVGGALLLRSSAAAQAPGERTLTFTELEKGSTFTHVRNTKGASRQSNLQGDVIAFRNPVADESGKVVGGIFVQCVTTAGSRNFLRSTITCTGVMTIPGGTLTLQANVRPGAATTTGAVTGGTGAYAYARGVITNTEGKAGSRDTITLLAE